MSNQRLSYLVCLASVFSAGAAIAAEPSDADDKLRGASRAATPGWHQPWHLPPHRPYIDRRFDDLHRQLDARRTARERQLERERREREAERQARRERWDEERRQAREAVLERERHYREEQLKHFPVLEGYRKRNAAELERRLQASERRRRERWDAFDKLWERE